LVELFSARESSAAGGRAFAGGMAVTVMV
jgi:hypothetical protein